MKFYDWIKRIPGPVIELINKLDNTGYETWLVGGCVRDMALGIIPDDYDVATNAKPDQVCQLFDRCIKTGIKHGTVTVLLSNMSIEITTFRSEGPYTDGRRPDHVIFENDILPDLARRDFTINSMAWHPHRGLIDPFGGMSDLYRLQLRCVGPAAKRMQEDALRQIRAVRFSLTYNLKPNYDLIDAIKQECHKIADLSSERLSQELDRLMIAPYSYNLACFTDTLLMSAVVKKILRADVDDKVFSKNLECFIQPFWSKEQIWPAFYLAYLMTFLKIKSQYENTSRTGYYTLENWLSVKTKLARIALMDLKHMLISNAKISKNQARYAETILVMIGLRLMLFNASLRDVINNHKKSDRIASANFDNKYQLSAYQIKILIRSCMHRTKFSVELLMKYLVYAIEIIDALLIDPLFKKVLERDKKLIKNMEIKKNSFLMQNLNIKGDNRLFDKLTKPSLTRLYLERLLSLSIYSDIDNSTQVLESILKNWLDYRLLSD